MALGVKLMGQGHAICQRLCRLGRGQRPQPDHHRAGAQIAVRLHHTGRLAGNGRMARQINGIGDQGGGNIGGSGGFGQHRHAIGHAHRQAAPAAPAGGNAAHAHRGLQGNAPQPMPI